MNILGGLLLWFWEPAVTIFTTFLHFLYVLSKLDAFD